MTIIILKVVDNRIKVRSLHLAEKQTPVDLCSDRIVLYSDGGGGNRNLCM